MLIARKLELKNQKEKTQSLKEHLYNVASIAYETGKKVDLEFTSFMLGLFHDLGKASSRFQNYIINDTNQKIDHSSIGGKYIYDIFVKKSSNTMAQMIAEVLAYSIFCHHGLSDFAINDRNEIKFLFDRRLNFNEENYYDEKEYKECIENIIKSIVNEKLNMTLEGLFDKSFSEMKIIMNKINKLSSKELGSKKYDENNFRTNFLYNISLLIRLLVSILKDADIFDSKSAFIDIKREKEAYVFEKMSNNLEKIYDDFKKGGESEINRLRQKFADDALNKAKSESCGKIITAKLPTGSGKTLACTRFAINKCIKSDKDRFFYIVPYLSVAEQNAKVIRNALKNEDHILEYHSNIIIEEPEKMNLNYIKDHIFTEMWDKEVIITTMVQFLNSSYKQRSSNLTRFSKYINSVIVLDETQNLPTDIVTNFNLLNNFLAYIMNATIIHSTATQPNYDSEYLQAKLLIDDDISEITDDIKNIFKRTDAYFLKEDTKDLLIDHILNTAKNKNSLLIISNTKSQALDIYNDLCEKSGGFKLYYLSTNQCAAHRIKKIKEIKNDLKNGNKIIVSATQLVEAGVDFDFDVVYRSLAAISSLIQAQGRCNREGRKKEGIFYFFDNKSEHLNSLKEIKNAKNLSAAKLSEIDIENEVDLDNLKDKYYESLYLNNDKEDFELSGTNKYLMDLLSDNSSLSRARNLLAREKNYKFNQSLKTAAMNFELIQDKGTDVIVTLSEDDFYDEAIKNKKLIDDYRNQIYNRDFKNANKTIKKLQLYTVKIYNIEKIKNHIEIIDNIYVLREGNYNYDIGTCINEKELLLF
ncbi:MAG: CRISPR-associated helicase Cas3' [Tissierellia bacterium]|nr:CRISPR-associated helicase Cas3' [Tissierellia bacterium]